MTDHVATALANSTPVEIDTALAEIYVRYYEVRGKIAMTLKHLKEYQKALAKKAAEPRYALQLSCYTEAGLVALEEKYETLQEEAVTILAETLPYESEFRARGGWSRFHLVKNNGGHIHSSMACSTCYPTTEFGWLPQLSGQTEAEAVAAHGAILCTVCFPSAPVEYTDGRKPGYCEGTTADWDKPHRKGYAYGNWGTCSTCGETAPFTNSRSAYRLRKHKTPSA